MAPILIDNRDLTKLGLTAILIIVLAFAGGYHFGRYQATMGFAFKNNKTEQTLSTPVRQVEDEYPELVENNKNTGKSQATDVAGSPAHASIASDKSKGKQIINVTKTDAKPVITTTKAKQTVTESDIKQVASQTSKDNADAKNSEVLQSSVDNEVKFSVQVAVYGRLDNAEKMMEGLHEKGLDAYVSDYTNKKNKRWFNVRFGYFKDKNTANTALKQYIDKHDGDGYLVNFSAENIVSSTQDKSVEIDNKNKINNKINKSTIKSKSVEKGQGAASFRIKSIRLDAQVLGNNSAYHAELNKLLVSS